MNTTSRLLRRVAAATTTLGLTASGLLVLGGAAPAQAVLRESDFALKAASFGTAVAAQAVGLSSEPTAQSIISCTRLTGLNKSNAILRADAPQNNPNVQIGAASNTTSTFRNAKQGIVAGSQATSRIADINLIGDEASGASLRLRAVEVSARTWATKDGKLRTATTADSLPIALDIGVAEINGPLQDLLDAVGGGLDQVLEALGANNGAIEIPGFAMIKIGGTTERVRKDSAVAMAQGLVINLYGPNMAPGGNDDTKVIVGSATARILRDAPAGVMRGRAWGLNATLIDSVLQVGRLGNKYLPCTGTDGKIQENAVAGLDLGNADVLGLGAVRGRAFGVQRADGRARAWTEGSVASIKLGSGDATIEIKGVVGRVNLAQNRAGKIVANNFRGSTIGSITVNGEAQEFPDPGQAIEIPGVAKLEFFVTTKKRRSATITALRVTLLDGTPGVSVVNLGNARASLFRG